MTDTPLPPPGGLSINWKIPLAVAASILATIAWNSYYVGGWKAGVDAELATHTLRLDAQRDRYAPDHDILIGLAATLRSIDTRTTRIEAKIDRAAPP